MLKYRIFFKKKISRKKKGLLPLKDKTKRLQTIIDVETFQYWMFVEFLISFLKNNTKVK